MTDLPARLAISSVLALGTKWLFASESVEQVRWLLAPTAALTSGLTGFQFTYEAGVGYSSQAARFDIVPACAGVTLLSVVLGVVVFETWARERWALRLVTAIGVALAVTLIANALRVSLCVGLHVSQVSAFGLSEAALHRLVGLVISTTTLVAVSLWKARLNPGRVLAAAIGWYLFVLLGLPLVRGTTGEGFATHARWTVATALLVGLVGFVVSSVEQRLTGTAAPRPRTPRESRPA